MSDEKKIYDAQTVEDARAFKAGGRPKPITTVAEADAVLATVARKPDTRPVHCGVGGFIYTPDAGGDGFAVCGARVAAVASSFTVVKGGGITNMKQREMNPIEPSSEDLARVTCPKCRERIRTIQKAYVKARRFKHVAW